MGVALVRLDEKWEGPKGGVGGVASGGRGLGVWERPRFEGGAYKRGGVLIEGAGPHTAKTPNPLPSSMAPPTIPPPNETPPIETPPSLPPPQ